MPSDPPKTEWGFPPCLYVFTVFFQTLSHTSTSKVPLSETRDYNNKQLASNVTVVIFILVLIHSLKDDSHLDIRQSLPGFCPIIRRPFLLWGSPVFHLRASCRSLCGSEDGGTWENGADEWGPLKSHASHLGGALIQEQFRVFEETEVTRLLFCFLGVFL